MFADSFPLALFLFWSFMVVFWLVSMLLSLLIPVRILKRTLEGKAS